MNIHRQSLLGLMMLVMLILVACGGESSDGDATLTFEQALSATQTAIAFQSELAIALQATETANMQATQQAIINATATQQVIATATQQAIINAIATRIATFDIITRNEDWTPIEQEFDGVVMVLVPKGCFMMGTETGDTDERPVHEQCFNEPFWIDRYEVTQAQFAQFGGQKANPNYFTGDDLPVESITWFEARDFCELRGGRLPTEREWEYAARGPNNLIYPWGNEFVANNVVYGGNSNDRTAPVGSRAGGVSWVGAVDMSGNVWEWVSSLYGAYPYDEESRESINDNTNRRVVRGGSWVNPDWLVRSADRDRNFPSDGINPFGFRCVRSQE